MKTRAVVAALAILALTASGAAADPPGLAVTDLGQSTAPVVVGQPPVAASQQGSCASPFTLAASCPAGSWPGLGSTWGSTVDVAGGDTLSLSFSRPVTSVATASTTNFQPGLTDPSGRAVVNHDVMTATAATATADPSKWNAVLPPLDPIALGGLTFSVVASDSSGTYDYPLTIRTPRFADESRRCGPAYYSTGNGQYLCGGPKAPPPSAFPQLASAEHATFRHRTLNLRLTVPEAGTLRLTLTLPTHRRVTAVRHPHAAGTFRVALRLRHTHFPRAHRRIALHLSLDAPAGAFTRTQAVSVNS